MGRSRHRIPSVETSGKLKLHAGTDPEIVCLSALTAYSAMS